MNNMNNFSILRKLTLFVFFVFLLPVLAVGQNNAGQDGLLNMGGSFGSGTTEDMINNVGISRMVRNMMADSPMRRLASLTGQGRQGESDSILGSRLVAAMQATGSESQTQQRVVLGGADDLDLAGPVIVDNMEGVDSVNISSQIRLAAPRLVVNFDDFPLSQNDVSKMNARVGRLEKSLEKRLSVGKERGHIKLELYEKTLILRGTVESEQRKELVEMTARMEPGIDEVRNELQVLSAVTTMNLPTDSSVKIPKTENRGRNLLEAFELE